MPYELCRHIKTNGRRCQSPALKQEFWCYFHARLHFRHRELRATKAKTAYATLLMPTLEDRESIQVALSVVVEAIAIRRIDDKHGANLLRGLHLACRNLGRPGDLITQPMPESVERSYIATLDGLSLAPPLMNDNSKPPVPTP